MAPLLPSDLVPGTSIGILALPLFVVVVTSGGLLLLPPLTQPRRVAWLLCLLDVVLVTAVVAATGGPRAVYALLYVLSVPRSEEHTSEIPSPFKIGCRPLPFKKK